MLYADVNWRLQLATFNTMLQEKDTFLQSFSFYFVIKGWKYFLHSYFTSIPFKTCLQVRRKYSFQRNISIRGEGIHWFIDGLTELLVNLLLWLKIFGRSIIRTMLNVKEPFKWIEERTSSCLSTHYQMNGQKTRWL